MRSQRSSRPGHGASHLETEAPDQVRGGSEAQVWDWLAEVSDPEIPVISVVDLGIVRDVARKDAKVMVTLTPTYSGCPATAVIEMDVAAKLREKGLDDFEIQRRISPPWTTAWISETGRKKLEDFGIAPPRAAGGPARCPQCGSNDLEKISQFGSTPCKAQWRCRSCREPFDYFKCI